MQDRGEGNLENDRSTVGNQNATGKTLTGVDLQHPPKGIENLADVDKRFLAGAIRESYVQGLSECSKSPSTAISRDRGFQLADQWMGRYVPFLADVIGDARTGGASR